MKSSCFKTLKDFTDFIGHANDYTVIVENKDKTAFALPVSADNSLNAAIFAKELGHKVRFVYDGTIDYNTAAFRKPVLTVYPVEVL